MNTFNINSKTTEIVQEISIADTRVVLTHSMQNNLLEAIKLDRFNVYLLDKFDNFIWQIKHDIPNTKPFKSLRMENVSKLIASCDTDYPWQAINSEIDLSSGIALCIKDTHGIWI